MAYPKLLKTGPAPSMIASSQDDLTSTDFSPPCDMLHPDLEMWIISDFCKDLDPLHFEEAGCAVCGQLVPKHDLVHLKTVKNFLNVLEEPGVMHEAWQEPTDKIHEYYGPVIDHSCNMVCITCWQSLRGDVVPHLALCRKLWIGPILQDLSDLNIVEKCLLWECVTTTVLSEWAMVFLMDMGWQK